MREIDLAARVIGYLRDLHYEVHQEAGGADIVALLDGRAWIIECKLTLGLDVLAQAWNWVRLGAAPYVSVATPVFRRSDGRSVAEWFLRQHGIGWLEVTYGRSDDAGWKGEYPVTERLVAQVQRGFKRQPYPWDIRRSLNDKTRDGYAPAGSPAPRQWTPFKQLCENVVAALRQAPLTTRELVDRVEHHYSTPAGARSRLSHYLSHGIIRGVEQIQGTKPARWKLAP